MAGRGEGRSDCFSQACDVPFALAQHPQQVNPDRGAQHRQCLRCVRGITSKAGRKVFAAVERGPRVTIEVDPNLAAKLSEEEARRAMDICPVGAILRKEKGFALPIGQRKFDHTPIGSDIEKGTGR